MFPVARQSAKRQAHVGLLDKITSDCQLNVAVGRQSDERRPNSSPSAHVAVGPPSDRPRDKMTSDRQLNVAAGPTAMCYLG